MSNKIIALQDCRDNWFTCIDNKVLRDRKLTFRAKYIFSVLCMIAGFGHRSCSPSNKEVADIVGVSERTIIRAYKELEARGVITREARINENGQGKSITYLIGCDAPCYSEEDA